MEKEGVITLSYTSSEPNAMVIKAHDTIIAIMAVTSSQWSDDVARFTVFHLISVGITADSTIRLNIEIHNL